MPLRFTWRHRFFVSPPGARLQSDLKDKSETENTFSFVALVAFVPFVSFA
jgi:hypothetical protein